MTAILDDLLFMRYPGLKYIHVFDGILRRAEELEHANQKDIADLMRSRVEVLVREPDRCAKGGRGLRQRRRCSDPAGGSGHTTATTSHTSTLVTVRCWTASGGI